ncbi:MAG: hypothetical protein ACC742_08975, partial [Thermoanaerobaculales bacterium]
MAQTDTRHRLRIALAGLCWLATVGPLSASESLVGDTAGGSTFRLTVAESLDDRGTEAGFDLDLQAEVDARRTSVSGPPATAQAGTQVVLLPGAPDWTAPPPSAETEYPATATGTEKTERIPERPYGWEQLRFDLKYLARKPAHLNAREKRGLLAVTGTTALLYVYRKDIRDAWQENSSESRTNFLNAARFMGDGSFAPGVALAAYLASLVTHNDREKETAQLVLESAALSAVGSGVGSFVLAAERPEDGDAMRFFSVTGHGVSLDVSLAASVIPPLRRQYLRVRPEDRAGRRILKHGLSALLYSGMVFTALQRVDADRHWAPDVFLGMVNGIAIG